MVKQSEEQFPLLLVLMPDRSNTSQNNKRYRFNTITNGANSLMTEWPDYVSTCWLATLICAFIIFSFTVLLSCTVPTPMPHRYPRCTSQQPLQANNTIHLVHIGHNFNAAQLDIISSICRTFPQHHINLIVICSEENSPPVNASFADNYLAQFSNILVSHWNYSGIFNNSPLASSWESWRTPKRVFAARVIQMWQFGGLSFDLLEPDVCLRNCSRNINEGAIIKRFVAKSQQSFEALTPNGITVDFNGYHMGCKTPCHTFFEGLLMKMQYVGHDFSVKRMLGGSIFNFCRRGVIDKRMCQGRSLWF